MDRSYIFPSVSNIFSEKNYLLCHIINVVQHRNPTNIALYFLWVSGLKKVSHLYSCEIFSIVLSVSKVLFYLCISEISKLKLTELDLSGNKISHIPNDLRMIDTLDTIKLENNPLLSPPANVSIQF